MYKDPEKQKQANKEAKQRYKDKQKRPTMPQVEKQGIPAGGHTEGIPQITQGIPSGIPKGMPANYGLPTCMCMHCQQNRHSTNPAIINHGLYKAAEQLQPNELNRQSLPGDTDYTGAAAVATMVAG